VSSASRVLRPLGRAALVAVGLGVVEAFALLAGFSPFGILLALIARQVVLIGAALGLVALAVDVVRRRSGRPAGGISAGDAAVHAVLLLNATLLVPAFVLGRGLLGPEVGLAAAIATGTVALVGVPVSVWLSWARAFTPVDEVATRARTRVRTLRAAFAVGLVVAALTTVPLSAPPSPLLLGSIAS
jgi:hypothetical protein